MLLNFLLTKPPELMLMILHELKLSDVVLSCVHCKCIYLIEFMWQRILVFVQVFLKKNITKKLTEKAALCTLCSSF